ncbi:MAG TPA: hypothetical protein EYQ70_00330 [Marine Group III euryarchaeote]|jgi:hypothetical protein|uniref:Tail tube protein n=1 Tax=Marine Group III euryarchaeote TaxID=2173149 RepID=A0A7J4GQD6_9ARCH|nr:hypothetical protein [Marine Group III euryarchaeote]
MAATFSPNTIKALLNSQGGIAYNDKYMVTLNKPPAFDPPGGMQMRQNLSMLCDTATLPTKSLATFEKTIYGPVKAMPYRMTFTEASMSFIMTDGMKEKKYFDAWQNKIVDQKNGNLGFFDDYVCDILIQKFGRTADNTDETPTYAVKLLDAWPSIVSEIQLSHSGGTEAMKLPVTFQYKKWESTDVATAYAGPSSGAGARN